LKRLYTYCRVRAAPPRPPCRSCIRQHTSAYVSIRQHTSACVRIRQHTSAYVSIRQHASACVSIRPHTSAYVSIRCVSASRPLVMPQLHAERAPASRQYLYFCTCKASSKVSTNLRAECAPPRAAAAPSAVYHATGASVFDLCTSKACGLSRGRRCFDSMCSFLE
jgi:hypothetical protein